jgi:predicted transcriptional regulator
LEREHAKRLEELAAVKGLSKSAIVAAALASFLSPEGADRREAAIARRLDKLQNQGERFGRDQMILIETLALFIRVYLSVSTPIPEGHQEAARAQGKARFEQFITQLGRDLQRGSNFVKTLERETVPADSRTPNANDTARVGDHAP